MSGSFPINIGVGKSMNIRFSVSTAKNELNSDFIIIPAEKGRMLIWPSHVPHAVEQGTADETEDRITVPFNVMIRGRIELFTASLNLS
jgi:Putative 2OG-Fe(II) oxygenase